MKVRTCDDLWGGLRFEQRFSRDQRAAPDGPDARGVLPLREDNTGIMDAVKRFVQEARKCFFILVIGGRECNTGAGKGMGMNVQDGVNIIPAGQFNQVVVDEVFSDS